MPHLKRWIFATAAIAVVAAVAITGCKKSGIDPFPASGAVKGWQKTGETRTFVAKNLYQYIDGDAEQYIAAGVISSSTSDYKYEGQLEAVVDVHFMNDAVGARKIMENGKTADAKTVMLGDSGLSYTQSVIFHKGPYLVRVVAYESSPETQEALLVLARGIEAKL